MPQKPYGYRMHGAVQNIYTVQQSENPITFEYLTLETVSLGVDDPEEVTTADDTHGWFPCAIKTPSS